MWFVAGLKELRLFNWDNLLVDVSKINFALLTHGHLDHNSTSDAFLEYLSNLNIKPCVKIKLKGNCNTIHPVWLK